ncbi:MAG: DUF4860 domain-containing protein [Clostridiales Family XIII bacterium]|jgi:hypothetical protein|nr:DUF4860 domain-containing protein [Clostridiales Family XIII bacterium]
MGKRKHAVNLMFTITLLGVFALSAIFVATMGARIYANSAEHMQANFDTRTSLVYIAEKIRQSAPPGYAIGSVDGQDALILREEVGEDTYETLIFVRDGKLRELVTAADADTSGMEGEAIMDLRELHLSEEGSTLRITILNGRGDEESIVVGRRTGT